MQTLPKEFPLRKHNEEIYVQSEIHRKLHFLSELPLVQNEYGEFTSYVTSADADDKVGDPVTIAEGVEFNEIDFGKPSEKRGATVAKGFMFKVTDKMIRQGRADANVEIFLTKAVSRMAIFYNDLFLTQFKSAAAATAPSDLSDWGDSSDIDPIADEIKICDAMDKGGDSGFTAGRVYLSRADYLARQLYMKSFDSQFKSELEYVPVGSSLPTGTALVVDTDIKLATIEKFADPNYSQFRKAEVASVKPGAAKNLSDAVPESFINVWKPEMKKPGVHEIYVWAEANANVVEPKGIMQVNIGGT